MEPRKEKNTDIQIRLLASVALGGTFHERMLLSVIYKGFLSICYQVLIISDAVKHQDYSLENEKTGINDSSKVDDVLCSEKGGSMLF